MLSFTGALIGAPVIGWISSRLEEIKRPYIFFYLVNLCCWSTFLFFDGRPPMVILVFLFLIIGFCFGANSLTFAAVRQSFSVKEAGFVTGFANTGGFLSAVLLPGIFGAILDHIQLTAGNGSTGYYYGLFTPVLFCIIGLFGVCFMKESKEISDILVDEK